MERQLSGFKISGQRRFKLKGAKIKNFFGSVQNHRSISKKSARLCIKDVEVRFLSILDSLRKTEYIKRLDSYKYVKNAFVNEATISRYFDARINDIRYVKDSIEGREIIDAGCGSGSLSVLLSLLGAKKVYAVDFGVDCIEMTKCLIDIASLNNIEVIRSDIGQLYLPKESIDGIFSIEAISHYRDYKSFLDVASKVLKKSGFLVIRDGNNRASAQIKKNTFKIWHAFEKLPGAMTIFGHQKGSSCYEDMRKGIIKNEFSSLTRAEIEKFARYTFAYSEEKIIKAVRLFIKKDFSLKSEYSYGKCPLDPITNCYMERLFNPKGLKREMERYGFKSRIKSNGPGSKNLRVLRYIWELFSSITIFLPRGFQLIAIKRFNLRNVG